MPSKTKRFINKTLKPMMGGALLENLAGESASGEHYTKKLNFRRHQEGEARREGWDVFKPSGKLLEAFPQLHDSLPGNDPIRLICQFRSGDGKSCLVVIAGGTIYKYSYVRSPEYINKIPPPEWQDGTYFVDGYIEEPSSDYQWEVIGSGFHHVDQTVGDYFANEVINWEAAVVNSTLYLNNGKDLPIVYREEYSKVIPLLELRESPAYRVAAVGTISEFSGFLMLGDIQQIAVNDWENWMKMTQQYLLQSRYANNYMYPAYRWDPQFYNEQRTDDRRINGNTQFWIDAEKTENKASEYNESGGISLTKAQYQSLPERTYGINLNTSFNSSSDYVWRELFLGKDLFEADPEYSDPYGPVLDSGPYERGEVKTTRSPYSIIWSYEGDGMRYGTAVYGTMAQGSNEFIAKYPLKRAHDLGGGEYGEFGHPATTFPVGEEVVIVGAGDEIAELNGIEVNGVLQAVGDGVTYSRISVGEVINNDDGTQTYRIVDKDGNPISAPGSIVEEELATPIVNSTTGYMIRLDSVGKKTSVVDLVDDGSRILKMKTLVDRLMIYRDTGYMTAIRVNTAEVFQFERRYSGSRVVDFRNTLIDVAGRFHVFMSFNGIYQVDRAASQPKLLQSMDKGTRFWEDLSGDDAERVFTVDNSETREVFFCTPEKTFAFDYETNTVSEIDQVFTAGAGIIRPYTSKKVEHRWVILALTDTGRNIQAFADNSIQDYNFLVRYGKGPDGYQVYNRYGNEYKSVLQSGLIDFTDQFNDKDIRSYALHVAENTLNGTISDAKVKVRISVVPTSQATVDDITEVELNEEGEFEFTTGERIEAEVLLADPRSENMIPLYLRGPYFRDAIIIEGKDNPVKLIGRTFEVSGVASKLSQTAFNQG